MAKSDIKKSTVKSKSTKKVTPKKDVSKNVQLSSDHHVYNAYMGTCRFLIVLFAMLFVSGVFFMVGFSFKEETDNYPYVKITQDESSDNNDINESIPDAENNNDLEQ